MKQETLKKRIEKIINGDFRDYLYLFTKDAFIISDPPYNQDYHYSEYEE